MVLRSRASARAGTTAQEALAWARFPMVSEQPREPSGTGVSIVDLRYHLNGSPTLSFRMELDGRGRPATLDRGGSARSLLERFPRRALKVLGVS